MKVASLKNKDYICRVILKIYYMYDNLMTYANYAKWKDRNQQTVRDWVAAGKVKSVNIDGRLFVVLTDEEVQERKSLFSQHPTKGLHRIGDVMNAMLNGKAEE